MLPSAVFILFFVIIVVIIIVIFVIVVIIIFVFILIRAADIALNYMEYPAPAQKAA